MAAELRVLVVTGGHPFEAEPFFDVFDSNTDLIWQHASQPDAQELFTPTAAAAWDVIVLYDMPGIEFTRTDPPIGLIEPSAAYVAGFEALLESGKGLVFLHHAVAGWPKWPRYADIIGGRFHYQAASLRDHEYPDSGYRFDVTHTIRLLEPEHPICSGLPETFELTDELYLFPVFEDDVIPLMASGHTFRSEDFFSADHAIRGDRNSNEGWSHPPGSNLVAWVRAEANSPIAYLQFGDGPETYRQGHYRKAVGNAITWAGSDEAHGWARSL